MEPTPPTPPCQCCPQPSLGSSLIVINHAGSLSQEEIAAIISNEVSSLSVSIERALRAANYRKESRLAIERYDRELGRWYSGQRRYARDHAPTFMAALLTHPDPASTAIEKANELYLALHPKPHAPFPDMEAARREYSNNLQATAGEEDLGPEALAAAEAAIAADPERKAFLLRMKESGVNLRERVSRLRTAGTGAKVADLAGSSGGGDPAATLSDAPVAAAAPAPGSQESLESPPTPAPGPQDALPADANDSSSCSTD